MRCVAILLQRGNTGEMRGYGCDDRLRLTTDVCQMPAPNACTNDANPTCTVQAAPINGCQPGQYCCQHGTGTTPNCDANIANLQLFNTGCQLPAANICLAGATPTPIGPTPTPTPTPVPPRNACSSSNLRELAVVNQANKAVWVGGGGGALRAMCTVNASQQCIPEDGHFDASTFSAISAELMWMAR